MTSPVVPELIPVRTDECFDEAALHAYLRDKLDGGELPLRVEQFEHPPGPGRSAYYRRFLGDERGAVRQPVLR